MSAFAAPPSIRRITPSALSVAYAVDPREGGGTMTTRPLIGAVLALATGILAASLWPASVWFFLTTFLLFGLLFLFTQRQLWGQITLLLLFALVGFFRLQQASL